MGGDQGVALLVLEQRLLPVLLHGLGVAGAVGDGTLIEAAQIHGRRSALLAAADRDLLEPFAEADAELAGKAQRVQHHRRQAE